MAKRARPARATSAMRYILIMQVTAILIAVIEYDSPPVHGIFIPPGTIKPLRRVAKDSFRDPCSGICAVKCPWRGSCDCDAEPEAVLFCCLVHCEQNRFPPPCHGPVHMFLDE
jgi:hypothetical protein